MAAVLGLLDESPGLAAACRRASGQRLDAAELAGLCWQLGPRLRVLTGIPIAARWPELRPTAVGAGARPRPAASPTSRVIDCGFCLETDEELSFDTLAPRRNGATLAVLDDADLIMVVGAADPIGMQRLVRALSELRDAEVSAPTWVVLNRVRSGVVPGDADAELRAALQRFAGRAPGGAAARRCQGGRRGSGHRPLARGGGPTSALRRAVVDLAAQVAGVPVAASRGRRRRSRAGRPAPRIGRRRRALPPPGVRAASL